MLGSLFGKSKSDKKKEQLEGYRQRKKYSIARGEADIVQESQVNDNCRIRLYEGYLKDTLSAATITRIGSWSLDSEVSSDAELESMLAILEQELTILYQDLDIILRQVKGNEKLPVDTKKELSIQEIQKWRSDRLQELRDLIIKHGPISMKTKILRSFKSFLGKEVPEKDVNDEIYQELKRREYHIETIYSNILKIEHEIDSLNFIRFQDELADYEKDSLNQVYVNILDKIKDKDGVSLESLKSLSVHFERERQKYNVAKSQNLSGFKREIYRVDDRNKKKSTFISRIIPAGHNILSEMSEMKETGWKYNEVEKWKDRLIYAFLIITNIISLAIAFSTTLREVFLSPNTWGYASGYLLTILVSWVLISAVSKEITAYDATYNIEKVMQNETIIYFDKHGKLQTIVTDIYDLELINSLRNNLDVSLGRSANDVANLTNHTMVRMARELYKKIHSLILEIDVANEEKQSHLQRIQDLKEQIDISYFQGLIDGADLRGQVLIQMGETRNKEDRKPLLSLGEDSTKIIVIGIVIVSIIFLFRSFFTSTEFVFDFTSPVFQWAMMFVVGIIALLAIAMVISVSRR